MDAVEFRQGWSVAKNEENVKKRKEDDQGRWSVASRRGREKVPENIRDQKARRWLREGKVPCVLNQEFLFWLRVLGF